MHDPFFEHWLKCAADASQTMQCILLTKTSVLRDQLIYNMDYVSEAAVGAVLHDYVVVVCCLDHIQHCDDVLMLQ